MGLERYWPNRGLRIFTRLTADLSCCWNKRWQPILNRSFSLTPYGKIWGELFSINIEIISGKKKEDIKIL